MPALLLGVGANLGDRQANIKRALDLVEPEIHVVKSSPLYETEPQDAAGGPYLNMACSCATELAPLAALERCQAVERSLGRERLYPGAPRTIDLDLLFYDDLVMSTPELVIPHPRLAQRAFTLIPLRDIAPDFRHPVLGRTVRELCAQVSTTGVRPWNPT